MSQRQTVTSIRVNEDIWKDAKVYCIRKNITLTDLLERLLKEELDKARKKGEF